jgi:hypothetical protein
MLLLLAVGVRVRHHQPIGIHRFQPEGGTVESGPASRAPRRLNLVTAVFLALASACSPRVPDYDIQVDTLPDGVVHVYNMNFLTADRSPELELVEELRLGSAPGAPEEVFSRLVGLTVDNAGSIYLADEASQEIRVFDSQGQLLRRFGGRGQGPGAFQNLVGIVWHPAGVLLAMDRGSRTLTALDSLGTVRSTAEHHSGPAWTPATDTLGFLYEQASSSPPWARLILKARLLPDFTLATVDTIALPARAPATDSAPTFWRSLWSAGPAGSFWHGNTLRFRIFEVSARRDTTRIVELRRTASLLVDREREQVAAAMGLPPHVLPRYKPVMGSFDIAGDESIWVRDPDAYRIITRWQVFDQNGYHKGVVTPPVALLAAPPPVFAHGTIIGVTEDDAGVQYVVRLRVRE